MDWRSLTGIIVGVGAIAFGQGADGGQLAMLLQPAAPPQQALELQPPLPPV